MGDFNPTSPTLRGCEWTPTSASQWVSNQGTALAMRVRPGAVTVTAVDLFLSSVVGNPGVQIEVLQPTGPLVSSVRTPAGQFFPGTDVGATLTNWQDQAAAAATFARVDDAGVVSDYLRNSATLAPGSTQDLKFRLGAFAPALQRFGRLTLKAVMRYTGAPVFGNPIADAVYVYGVFDLGGVAFFSPTNQSVFAGSGELAGAATPWQTYTLWATPINPSTNVAWTNANVTAFAGTDEFGLRVVNSPWSNVTIATQTVQVASLWFEADYADENRLQSGTVSGGQLYAGWNEVALANIIGGATTANQWHYIVILPTGKQDGGNYFTVPILSDGAYILEAPNSASATGEHRRVYDLTVEPTSPQSGLINASAARSVGQMIPVLIDAGGTINSQSQPYCETDTVDVYSGSVTNFGTEITSAAGATTYGGIRLVLGWQNVAQRPDAPLTITIRSTAGFLTGGGALNATVVVNPSDLASGALQRYLAPIVGGFTSGVGATQYGIALSSPASNGKGWKVVVLDSRSEILAPTGGVSTADVQGATQGGTADSYYTNGTEDDRYDLPLSVVQSPTAPAGLAATPAVAL